MPLREHRLRRPPEKPARSAHSPGKTALREALEPSWVSATPRHKKHKWLSVARRKRAQRAPHQFRASEVVRRADDIESDLEKAISPRIADCPPSTRREVSHPDQSRARIAPQRRRRTS